MDMFLPLNPVLEIMSDTQSPKCTKTIAKSQTRIWKLISEKEKMGFKKKFRRHAAIATGNFGVIFKDVEIPPLPAAVNRMVVEINKDESDINELVMLISSTTAIAARLTMSSTEAPRCSTWTGLFIPIRIGPTALAPLSLSSSL